MNRSELLSLPNTVALSVLLDALLKRDPELKKILTQYEKPELPRPPRFDARIYRRGGFQWASETDLEGLRFWQTRYVQSAESGESYAEKDGKRADALARWIAWREVAGAAPWTGTRDNSQISAHPPSANPELHESGRGPVAPRQVARVEGEDDASGFDDVPF